MASCLSRAPPSQVSNTATAIGELNGTPYTASDTITTPVSQNPTFTLLKVADVASVSTPGTINYTITVDNTGDVSLTGISISDLLLGGLTGPSGDTNNNSELDADETWTYSGSYAVTQAVIDGDIDNTVTVDFVETDPAQTASETVAVIHNPSIALTKTGFWNDDGNFIAEVGETISYSFTVTNTGNVTLTNVILSDPGITLSGGPIPSLAVGASDNTTFTGTYTITLADINAGMKNNTATVTGTPPIGPDVTGNDSDSLSLPNPAISLTKTGAWNDDGDGIAEVGETISYSFTVTNTGNVTLTNITLSDPGITLSGGPIASLAIGATDNTTFTGTYTLSQADVDAGTKDNTATVTGTPPVGLDVTANDSDSVSLAQAPALSLDKTSGTANYNTVGNTLDYAYLVSNSGNVTLAGPVTGSDDKTTVTCPALDTIGDLDTDLDVGESVTCSASYTITQVDLDAGSVTNTATASADGTNSNSDNLTINAVQNPAIQVVKSSTTTDVTAAGQVVPYSFDVSNTGNVTLSVITFIDPNCDAPPQSTRAAMRTPIRCSI